MPCSDGHQFKDVYNHIRGVCEKVVDIDCIHPVALNGGAILMSGRLPEERQAHGKTMFENIIEASCIKKCDDVFIYTHFPCAVAMASGIGVVDQGLYLMMAKKRLKAAAPHLRVKCFFHIDMYDEVEGDSHKRRTYFVPKELWENEAFLLPVLHELKSEF